MEIFAVTISCKGEFSGEWYKWLSLQDMDVRCQSPFPEGKMAKPYLGKRSVGKLLLVYIEIKLKQNCGRHVVDHEGVFVADIV